MVTPSGRAGKMQNDLQAANLNETGVSVAIIKKIVFGLLVVVIVVVLIGFMLPRQFKVERAIAVSAPVVVVYPLVSAPANWQQWSVWAQRDKSMLMTFSGVGAGKGAKWAWQSTQEGNGEMEFVDEVSMQKLVYRLKLADTSLVSSGSLVLASTGAAATNVVWTIDGDLGNNPFFRYFGLFMDQVIGKDVDASLLQLKALAEKTAGAAAPPVATTVRTPGAESPDGKDGAPPPPAPEPAKVEPPAVPAKQ